MLIHASCAARDGHGVLLIGPPGSGKSDLVLRLLDRGFTFVSDDQVEIIDGQARPPPALAGLLEIRGLGIMRMAFVAPVPLRLAVLLGRGDRLPSPAVGPLGLPAVTIDPTGATAAQRVGIALDCALGQRTQVAGAFTAC